MTYPMHSKRKGECDELSERSKKEVKDNHILAHTAIGCRDRRASALERTYEAGLPHEESAR